MGMAYVKNRYGPVPARRGFFFPILKKPIRREEMEHGGEIVGEYVEGLPAERAVPLEEEELETVEYIIDRWRGTDLRVFP
jgi:hypothetical protein